jgi:glycosyltransferase involved in cell wall biosynthesis
VRLAHRLGVPAVVTAHGSDVRMLGGRFGGEMAAALREADRVIAVDPGMVERLVEHGADERAIVLLPMGIDERQFAPRPRDEARAVVGADSGTGRIVLFVGRRSREKGLPLLGQAVRSLGIRCFAAGPGELNVAGVEPLGVLRPEDLSAWLSAADVFCLPSLAEGMPVSVAEALACGTPVVATRVGGIPEQVRPGVNGLLVEPGDAGALRDALADALEREWSRDEIRRSSEPFWLGRTAPKLVALYEELLS